MNIFVSYRKQFGIAKDCNEAIKVIENFINPDLDEYLVCNNNILYWINAILDGKYPNETSCWTTNCGYNKKVHLRPTEHDSAEPVIEEIRAESLARRTIEFKEVEEEKKAYTKWLNEPRQGWYHVKLRYIYMNEEGLNIGDGVEEDVYAYSGYNAYMKLSVKIAELCQLSGRKFVRTKSLYSKSIEISYKGE